jgi:HEAT repeat protein
MCLPKPSRLVPYVLVSLLVLTALGGCGKREKSTDELIGDLKTGREDDRVSAARSLPVRTAEAERVIPALIEALKDKGAEVRASAAIKLGSFGEQAKDAIPALESALSDRDVRVREAAATALSRIDPVKYPTPPKAPAK